MKTESIKNKSLDYMCCSNLQQDYRSDGGNKVQLNLIEDGTNLNIPEITTVKKLVPRYIPLISSNFSNDCTVIYDENSQKRLMFPMEVLQRIKHLVLNKYINDTNALPQDTNLNIEVINTSGRIDVDEQMLYISASSEILVQNTGDAIASYIKEVNKALLLNNILTSQNANEITLDLSVYLKNEDAQGIDLGCEVIECLALDNLEILAVKGSRIGSKNLSKSVNGGLILCKLVEDNVLSQALEPSTALRDGVSITKINGINIRSEYELCMLWHCMKADAYLKKERGLDSPLQVTFVSLNNNFKKSVRDPEIIVSKPIVPNFSKIDVDNLKYDLQYVSECHNESYDNSIIQLNNFEKKILPLFQFVTVGCEKKLLKQMWDMHCAIFGDKCGADCSCLLHLPRLSEGISTEIDQFGFFLHFCPRFHKKLRTEFPGDLTSSIISNLLFLWELHKSNLNLEHACYESCGCTDFWNLFLHNLNIHMLMQPVQAIDMETIPRLYIEENKKSDLYRSISKSQEVSVSEGNAVSIREESKSEIMNKAQDDISISDFSITPVAPSCGIDTGLSKASNESPTLEMLPVNSIAEKMNGKRKVDPLIDENCEQGKSKQLRKDVKNEESFKITFNINSPLGFYCYTKKHRHRSYCVIFSVCPYQTDKRLKRGLIIDKTSTATEDTSSKKPVSSHETLKRRYEAAKSKSESIVLWFLSDSIIFNEDVESQYPENFKFWSPSGVWNGPPVLGWAGGAEVEIVDNTHETKEDPIIASVAIKALKSELKYSQKEDPSPSLKSVAIKIAEISASIESYNTILDSKTLLKIKSPVQKIEKKRVTFDESCKESDMDSEAKSYKRKNRDESTHLWSERVKKQFYCQKCEKRRQKLKVCELCQCCYSCGVKFPCPHESKRSMDQTRLLGKRYQLALKAAFGLSSVNTCEYKIESKDDDMKHEASEIVNPDISIAMELINQEPSLINKAFTEPVIGHSDNPLYPFTGKTLIFAATMHAKYDVLLQLLMAEADSTHKCNDRKTPLEHISDYCEKLKSKQRNTQVSETANFNAKLADFAWKRDLLSIFSRGIDLLGIYSALNSSYRVQVSVNGGKNIHLTETGKAHSASSNLYCVISWDKEQDDAYTTITVPLIEAPTWTSSEGYFLNVNSMSKESFRSKRMTFYLYKGNPNGKNVNLSSVSEKGDIVNHHANTSGTTGEFILPETEMLTSGTLVITVRKILHGRNKSVTKPLIGNEMNKERNQLATEAPQLVEDIIGHFDRVKKQNLINGESGDTFRTYYSSAVLGRMKCLHCAVYLENVAVVKRLLSISVNINEPSQDGTPLELARALSENCNSDSLSHIVSDLTYSTDFVANKITLERKGTNELNDVLHNKSEDSNHGNQVVNNPSNTSQLQNSSTPIPTINSTPIMDKPNWMLPNGAKPCFVHKCPKGAECKFIHIHVPEPGLLSAPYDDKMLKRIIKNKFDEKLHIQVKMQRGKDGQSWYTAAYQCPKTSTVYHAAGGYSGMCNTQNIWWYPSLENARSAVEFLVLAEVDNDKNSFHELVFNNELPTLENPEWMLKFPKIRACYAYYQVSGQKCRCVKGLKCKFSHIFTPQCSIPADSYEATGLTKAYKSCHNVVLKPADFQLFSKQGKNNETLWYTAAFTCPLTATVYSSCKGRNGEYSAQKIWWYPTKSDALCSVEAVVLTDMKCRNLYPYSPNDAITRKAEIDVVRNGRGDNMLEQIPSSKGPQNAALDKLSSSSIRKEAMTARDNRNSMRSINFQPPSPSLGKFTPPLFHSLSTSRDSEYSAPNTPFVSPPQLFNKLSNDVSSLPPRVPSPPLGKFGPLSFHSLSSAPQSPKIAPRKFQQDPVHDLSASSENLDSSGKNRRHCPSPPFGKFSPATSMESPLPAKIKSNSNVNRREPSMHRKVPSAPLGKFGGISFHSLSTATTSEHPSVPPRAPSPPLGKFGGISFHSLSTATTSEHRSMPPRVPSPPLRKFGGISFHSLSTTTTSEHRSMPPKVSSPPLGKFVAAPFRPLSTATTSISKESINTPSASSASQNVKDKKSNCKMFGNSHLPILERPDWMLIGQKKCNPCYAFVGGGCQKGIKCKFAHIHNPVCEALDDAYEADAVENFYREKYDIDLHRNDYHQLPKTGKGHQKWWAAAFKCPKTSTIYYASGGQNGHCSTQNIWWYSSNDDARHAVEGVVLSDLKNRNIYSPSKIEEWDDSDSDHSTQVIEKYATNTFHMLAMSSPKKPKKSVSKLVPMLQKQNWLLEEISTKSCPLFNRNGSCDLGKKCKLAHVYKFKGILPELPPDPKALFLTYEKFGFSFGSCNRFYKSEQGRNGKIWHTAGIRCPIDSTIYYAAGGANAHRSKQKLCTNANLFWYPSEESAKAACDGIVLYALRDRDDMITVKK